MCTIMSSAVKSCAFPLLGTDIIPTFSIAMRTYSQAISYLVSVLAIRWTVTCLCLSHTTILNDSPKAEEE